MNRFQKLALGSLVLASPLAAHAAIDVSAVVTEIQSAAAPIGLVAAAVLVIFATVKAWKLIRRAM